MNSCQYLRKAVNYFIHKEVIEEDIEYCLKEKTKRGRKVEKQDCAQEFF